MPPDIQQQMDAKRQEAASTGAPNRHSTHGPSSARRLLRSTLLPALLAAVALLAACQVQVTDDRQRRISECLRQCQAENPPGMADDGYGAGHGQTMAGTDSRSACEQHCHGIR